MESRQPEKKQATEGPSDEQSPRPRRFRIVKLEERIAPKKGGPNSKKCFVGTIGCYSNYCW
jgi:hypothetical protein